jgi:8'-apo-carotenoid 13,14-cleaving dioxygenase
MASKPNDATRFANDAVTDELTLTDLWVSGTLPAALSGQFLCIGPNRTDGHVLPEGEAAGETMVHAVSLHAGRAVSYLTRWITTDVGGPLGSTPAPTFREGIATKLVTFGRSILALGDGALAIELSAGLETIRRVDLAGAHRSLVAHSKVDPITGELHLFTFATDPSQLYVRVSPGGLTRTIRSISNAPNRVRELELTADDLVLLADGFVGVIGRSFTAEATWFETDTDAHHIATADAHDGSVVVYSTGPSLVRWVLHPRARILHREVLDATPQAFARSDLQPLEAARQYLWTVSAGAAYKHELRTGKRRSHDFAADRHPGVFVFITDPERSGADDGGWLVGFVHDANRNETDLVVLDAQTIERPAIATVHIPRHIPDGTDSMWVVSPVPSK